MAVVQRGEALPPAVRLRAVALAGSLDVGDRVEQLLAGADDRTGRLGARNSLRYFAPPALVLDLVLCLLLTPFLAVGVVGGWVAWVLALVYLGPVAYLALLVVAAVTSTGSLGDRVRFAAVLAVMHLSWGAGFLLGVTRGARDAVDTSRTES